MHAPLHSLTNLWAIDEALADLVDKHAQYPYANKYRGKLAVMIAQLRSEIAHRATTIINLDVRQRNANVDLTHDAMRTILVENKSTATTKPNRRSACFG